MNKKTHIESWPYIPTQPQWADIPWGKAAAINPKADSFIGHDGNGNFHFQERGNPVVVIVRIED